MATVTTVAIVLSVVLLLHIKIAISTDNVLQCLFIGSPAFLNYIAVFRIITVSLGAVSRLSRICEAQAQTYGEVASGVTGLQ